MSHLSLTVHGITSLSPSPAIPGHMPRKTTRQTFQSNNSRANPSPNPSKATGFLAPGAAQRAFEQGRAPQGAGNPAPFSLA